jgi:hypothetical protein
MTYKQSGLKKGEGHETVIELTVNSEYSHPPKLRLIASKTGNVRLDDVWSREFSDRRNVKIGAVLPDSLFGPKNAFVLMQILQKTWNDSHTKIS